jgi:hypothetical protein
MALYRLSGWAARRARRKGKLDISMKARSLADANVSVISIDGFADRMSIRVVEAREQNGP